MSTQLPPGAWRRRRAPPPPPPAVISSCNLRRLNHQGRSVQRQCWPVDGGGLPQDGVSVGGRPPPHKGRLPRECIRRVGARLPTLERPLRVATPAFLELSARREGSSTHLLSCASAPRPRCFRPTHFTARVRHVRIGQDYTMSRRSIGSLRHVEGVEGAVARDAARARHVAPTVCKEASTHVVKWKAKLKRISAPLCHQGALPCQLIVTRCVDACRGHPACGVPVRSSDASMKGGTASRQMSVGARLEAIVYSPFGLAPQLVSPDRAMNRGSRNWFRGLVNRNAFPKIWCFGPGVAHAMMPLWLPRLLWLPWLPWFPPWAAWHDAGSLRCCVGFVAVALEMECLVVHLGRRNAEEYRAGPVSQGTCFGCFGTLYKHTARASEAPAFELLRIGV